MALIAGLLRLGGSSRASSPVLKGFIIGLALTIIVGQFEDLPDTTLAVVIAAVIELVDVQ